MGVGDIFGNVFADCMATIGIIAIIRPIRPELPQLALFSGILMCISLVVALYFLRKKGALSAKHGLALVFLYAFFVIMQFIAEQAES